MYIFIATRLQNAYYLTNKDSTSTEPNTNGNGGWSTCYQSSAHRGAQFSISCNTYPQTPITREFAIAARTRAIELREVEIYGHGKYVSNTFSNIKSTHLGI